MISSLAATPSADTGYTYYPNSLSLREVVQEPFPLHHDKKQRSATKRVHCITNMAHLLGTPSDVPDALPRPLTPEERLIKKQLEEKWRRINTLPAPKAESLYSQTQYSPVYYKKVDFAPIPMAQVLYCQPKYAPIYYAPDPAPQAPGVEHLYRH